MTISPFSTFAQKWYSDTNIESFNIGQTKQFKINTDCADCTYNWKIGSIDRASDIIQGTLTSPSIITDPCDNTKQVVIWNVTIPRSGLWYLQVQNCNDAGCSAWNDSRNQDNIVLINCTAGTFYIHTFVPPPPDISFP